MSNGRSTGDAYWRTLSAMVGEDRRKEKRIPLAFPIEAYGFDRAGHFFSHRTSTLDVSESGCRFPVQAELAPGAVIAIRMVSRHGDGRGAKALLFQVAWCRHEANGWEAGVEKLQPEALWHMAFPKTRVLERTTA